jgi:hypothetical protein
METMMTQIANEIRPLTGTELDIVSGGETNGWAGGRASATVSTGGTSDQPGLGMVVIIGLILLTL